MLTWKAEAQSPEVLSNDVKIKYKSILQHLQSYDTTSIDLQEGEVRGEMSGYFEKDSIKLLQEVYYGDMEKHQTFYCFDRALVFLVIDFTETYNRPIYYDKKMAKENNDSTFFDPAKSNFQETRYYFSKEKLFRYTTVNGKNEETEGSIAPHSNAALDLVKYAHEKEKYLKGFEHHKQKH
jgi:hypothetical protein